jgi:hypothetical protein
MSQVMVHHEKYIKGLGKWSTRTHTEKQNTGPMMNAAKTSIIKTAIVFVTVKVPADLKVIKAKKGSRVNAV